MFGHPLGLLRGGAGRTRGTRGDLSAKPTNIRRFFQCGLFTAVSRPTDAHNLPRGPRAGMSGGATLGGNQKVAPCPPSDSYSKSSASASCTSGSRIMKRPNPTSARAAQTESVRRWISRNCPGVAGERHDHAEPARLHGGAPPNELRLDAAATPGARPAGSRPEQPGDRGPARHLARRRQVPHQTKSSRSSASTPARRPPSTGAATRGSGRASRVCSGRWARVRR